MKLKQKSVITAAILIVCFLVIAYFGGMLSSGSYRYAQQYEFKINKNQLIRAVEKFKSEHNTFNPPPNYTERDGFDTSNMHFNVNVFYRKENTIVYFFIDNEDSNSSFINLVSINEGLKAPEYKRVNKDFDRKDNLKVKKDFEERILDKLGLPYKNKGNGMFIFWK